MSLRNIHLLRPHLDRLVIQVITAQGRPAAVLGGQRVRIRYRDR